MSEQSKSRGALQVLGSSAEYAVSLALVVVCLVVAGVIWLSGSDAPETPVVAAPSESTTTLSAQDREAEEAAALAALQEQLRASMQEIEQRGREQAEVAQQQKLAEEERRRKEAALAAQQREAEQRLAKLKAELAARERAQAAAQERARQAERAAALEQQDGSPTLQQASLSQAQASKTPAVIQWDSCRQPEYPRASQAAGEEGEVLLSLDINAQGRVTSGTIKESSGFRRLDRTTLQALRKCSFEPATENGLAVASTGLIRFGWSLE